MKNYSDMLFDSAELVHKVLMNPKKYTTEETKIIIAGANTLAQTAKTAIQNEVLVHKLYNSKLHTAQLIHQVADEN